MDRLFAKKQILRMAQMNRFPKTEVEALGELVDALMTAPSEDIARAVITEDFLEEATGDTFCPMPAEIKSKILARLEDFRKDPDCPKCDDSGHLIFYDKEGLSYAERCTCWARRPERVYRKRPGDSAMSADFNKQLIAGAKALKGGK